MRDLCARFPRIATATLLALLLLPSAATAEVSDDRLWSDVDESFLESRTERDVVPLRYRSVALDLAALKQVLAAATLDGATDLTATRGGEASLSLPLPEGGFARFSVVESPIMEAGLAAKFPEIRTYRGQGIDGTASVRFDLTPAGFHAMIRSPQGSVYVDPYSRQDTAHYVSYRARDADGSGRSFECGAGGHDTSGLVARYRAERASDGGTAFAANGETLRTYRLAVAATGEYTIFHGGTVLLGQAAIVTAMNRVNGIYESELAIRMELVADNDLVVYTDPATDPYTNNSGGAMLGENQANLDAVIGSANYDVGHVFSTGGGGVASLGVPCLGGLKARGVTGLGAPTGDPFWVDYVAHEMGHQWGGNHTFNGDEGSCAGGNRNGGTAYEPGSGSTIQAYAGICGSQNLQSNSDAYFHGISLDEMIAYSTLGSGNGCAVPAATGNDPPSVEAGASYTIPLETPFELCGSGSDPNNDPLTFGWEQFDLGPAGAPGSPSGNAPIFRSFDPTPTPCRTFPRMSDLAAGSLAIGELLPTYARTLNFRLTARDGRSGGGGVGDDATTVVVSGATGPFRLTAPNTAVSLPQGTMIDVTWDVAATDQAPVSCTAVDVLLSSDGGLTYPTTLAASTANDGSATVALPASSVFAARVQVRCATNIFFDVSDIDFGIGVPQVAIVAPADGTTSTEGDPVAFSGTASDPEDGDLSASLAWASSIDGPIGSGATFTTSSLSLGSHAITASVSDSDTNTVSTTITVEVQPVCENLIYSAGYEVDNDGWLDGASTCTTGTFIRGTPDEVIDGGITTQPDGAATGSFAWFTANNFGGVGTDDVDGGTCETLSPSVNVGAGTLVTAFVDYFHGQRDSADDDADGFSIELIDGDTGALLATLVSLGDVAHQAVWTNAWAQHADSPAEVRLRVRATDGTAGGDLVEAGVDNVRICTGLPEGIFTDGFESGDTTAWSSSSR